jgi:hypothetical protein
MTYERRRDGEIVVVTGRARSGKTVYTMRAVARAARLLVWDSHLQWAAHGCTPRPSIAALAAACGTREPGQHAYTGPVTPRTFSAFCVVARCYVMLGPAVVVVEELADVSAPGKAPADWGALLRLAPKYGGTVYAITQRPSESDKTAIGNAARIICHATGRMGDAQYMASELGVELAAVRALDAGRLEYLERGPDFVVRKGRTPRPARPA